MPLSASGRVAGVRCNLLCLPSALLGHAWPAERVVVGLRVCQKLRTVLSQNAGSILMVKKANGGFTEDEDLVKDFGRALELKVALIWQGQMDSLQCLALLGTALVKLEMRDVQNGTRAEQLAEVLEKCRSLTHVDLRSNKLGHKGAGMLAGALG
eukprot:1759313-Rhodomonas_salina.1